MIIESFMMPPKLNAEILVACIKLTVAFYNFIYIEYNGLAFDLQAMKSRSLLLADVHLKKSCIFCHWCQCLVPFLTRTCTKTMKLSHVRCRKLLYIFILMMSSICDCTFNAVNVEMVTKFDCFHQSCSCFEQCC